MALARQAINQSRRLIGEALKAQLALTFTVGGLLLAINVCRRPLRGWRTARLLGAFTSLFALAASLPPLKVTILAPLYVTSGEPFAVAWFSSDAKSCKLSGGGSGWAQADAGASVSWSATHAKFCNLSAGGPGWRQSRAATFGHSNQVLSVPAARKRSA